MLKQRGFSTTVLFLASCFGAWTPCLGNPLREPDSKQKCICTLTYQYLHPPPPAPLRGCRVFAQDPPINLHTLPLEKSRNDATNKRLTKRILNRLSTTEPRQKLRQTTEAPKPLQRTIPEDDRPKGDG